MNSAEALYYVSESTQGCNATEVLFFHYSLATSMTNGAQILNTFRNFQSIKNHLSGKFITIYTRCALFMAKTKRTLYKKKPIICQKSSREKTSTSGGENWVIETFLCIFRLYRYPTGHKTERYLTKSTRVQTDRLSTD